MIIICSSCNTKYSINKQSLGKKGKKVKCSNCGYEDYRESDMMGPYLLNFLDGDNRNYDIGNLTLLCFNCFYLLKKPDMKSITTPRSIKLIQKKLTEVFDEN